MDAREPARKRMSPVEASPEILNRIAQMFLTVPDHGMYGEVLDVVLEALDSRFGFFGYMDDKGNLVAPSLTKDVWDACATADKRTVFPPSSWGGVWGKSLSEGVSLIANGGLTPPQGHVPLQRALCVPIICQGKLIGQLAVADKPTDYAEEDRMLLESIARFVSPVLHARLERDREEESRKRTEAALRESERKFSMFFHSSPHLAGLSTIADGKYLEVNRTFLDVLGFSPDEVIGRKSVEMGIWVDPEERHRFAADVLEHGSLRNRNITLLTKSGKPLEILCSAEIVEYMGAQCFLVVGRDISGIKQAQDALSESEKKLRFLLENAQDMLSIHSPDGTLLYVTPACSALLGYEPSQLVAVPLEDLIPPEDLERVWKLINGAVETGDDGYLAEHRMRRKNGEWIWVETSGRLIRGSDGTLSGIHCSSRDVSARKKAEERYRIVSEMGSDWSYGARVDADGSISFEWVTDAMTRFTGYTQEEILGSANWISYVHPEDRGRFGQSVELVLANSPASFEGRIVTRTGEHQWYHVNLQPVFDEWEGRVTYLYGTNRHITHEKLASEALRESERRFRAILEYTPLIALTVDGSARITFCNDYLLSLTGWEFEEVRGRDYFDVFIPPEADTAGFFRECVARDEIPLTYANEIITRSGERRMVEWNNGVLRDSMGRILEVASIGLDITERTRAHEAIARVNRMLESASRAAHIALWEWDMATGTLTWSHGVDAMLGYEPGTLPRTVEAWHNIIHPDDLPGVLEALNSHLEARVRFDVEYRVVNRRGEIVWWSDTGEATWDEHGTPVFMSGACVDINERRLMTEALKRSERTFENLVASLPHGVYQFRLKSGGEWSFDYVSDQFCKMTGLTRENILADPVAPIALVHPDEREDFIALCRTALATRAPMAWEGRMMLKGGLSWVRMESHPAVMPNGDVLWTGVQFDITAQKEAEETLRRSERELRSLVERSSVAMVIEGPGDRVILMNNKFTELFGYTMEDIPTAAHWWPLAYPDQAYRQEMKERWAERMEGSRQAEKGIEPFEAVVVCKDGSHRHIEFACSEFEGRTIISFLDVTARKAAEETLWRYGDQLEQLVEERTAQLKAVQEELVKKERLATLGKLTAMVSHELRNPLGTIRSSLFSIGERVRGRNPGTAKALDRAERAVVRCDSIIEELLDYTRVQRPVLEPTDLDPWLEGFLDEQPPPNGIRVTRHLCSGVRIPIDQQRIRRSLFNVLTNAFESIRLEDVERGRGSVHVESRLTEGRLEILVTDNGEGIQPGNLRKVFEPLFSTKSFGIGLGLPIVRTAMELHGGGAEVESEPGRGTTMTLWLPFSQADSPESP